MNEAQQALRKLVAAFPSQSVPAETLAVYVEKLADLPAKRLAQALADLTLTSERFPTIAAIRRKVSELAMREEARVSNGRLLGQPRIPAPNMAELCARAGFGSLASAIRRERKGWKVEPADPAGAAREELAQEPKPW